MMKRRLKIDFKKFRWKKVKKKRNEKELYKYIRTMLIYGTMRIDKKKTVEKF